ncbi:hypothetical protein GCM10009819_07600 [Agromyces tropicus]|uniref:Mycofactocin n=1 Tax=Agromyces tropicus TaxID=555371 RepID=A0ABN2U1T8_9MICO
MNPEHDKGHGDQSETVDAPVVVEDVLVEEVSIDGMCGVY